MQINSIGLKPELRPFYLVVAFRCFLLCICFYISEHFTILVVFVKRYWLTSRNSTIEIKIIIIIVIIIKRTSLTKRVNLSPLGSTVYSKR